MELDEARQQLDERGFVVLPGYLSAEELAAAQAGLPAVFPTADEFHDGVDPGRNAALSASQFAGIVNFPFASVDLSLVAVQPKLIELAHALLGTDDLRIYCIEGWAKYTGAIDYEQDHHRDYVNHTMLVPSSAPEQRQLEFFLYLGDVAEDLGPTHVVPLAASGHLGPVPSRRGRDDHPELYDAEVSGAGPAGTVLAYTTNTLHRGTNMTAPRGARFTIHINYRPHEVDWAQRHPWTLRAEMPDWHRFVERATPRQLELFGWPRPGHPYWTDETVAGVAARYPGLDLSPWR